MRASPAQGKRPKALRPLVVIDAGHGGRDPGAIGTDPEGERFAEKDITLAIALALRDALLKDGGVRVALTRAIAKEHKQLLKQQLGFAGYRIGELYPRRTRRATAVNWLLAHLAERGQALPEQGPMPPLLEQPADPVAGHPGDLPIR